MNESKLKDKRESIATRIELACWRSKQGENPETSRDELIHDLAMDGVMIVEQTHGYHRNFYTLSEKQK